MKLLVVLGSDDNYNFISRHIQPLGFDIVRYRHIIKTLDNIDEIDPAAIIVSARDFPRHWKALVTFVRNERTKEGCPIIILKNHSFSADDSTQAQHLGVNDLIGDILEEPAELGRLQKALGLYLKINERRMHRRCIVESWHRVGFIFAKPQNRFIVTGELKTISPAGLSFRTNDMGAGDIRAGTELYECSLRTGDHILSPMCRVTRCGRNMSMEFVSFPESEKQILEQYLDDFSA